MIIFDSSAGTITTDTPLSKLANICGFSDSNKTVTDLIREHGIYKVDDKEYVLINKPYIYNGSLPNADYNAFYADAIQLGDEYEDNYCCIYQLKWRLPEPISFDEFWGKVVVPKVGCNLSRLESIVDWECPEKIKFF